MSLQLGLQFFVWTNQSVNLFLGENTLGKTVIFTFFTLFVRTFTNDGKRCILYVTYLWLVMQIMNYHIGSVSEY